MSLGSVSGSQRIIVTFVLAMLLGACDPLGLVLDQQEGDTSMFLDGTDVVVEADLVAVTPWEVDDHWSEWELQIRSVPLVTETYRWDGARHDTPDLSEGDKIVAAYSGNPNGEALIGQTLFLAMTAGGPFEEMDDSVRGYPALTFSPILVFDDRWNPIAVDSANISGGSGAAIRDYREILELYDGSARSRALALVKDAVRSEHPKVELTIDGEMVKPLQKPAGWDRKWTPGPLGEWRRANDWEIGPESAEKATQQFVEAWMAVPAEERPLPVVEVDEQFGALQDLVGEVSFRDVTVITTDRFVEEYSWIGLRFPEVGVIGPFSTGTGGSNIASMVGYGPAVSEATLVGWSHKEFSTMGQAQTLHQVGLLKADQTSIRIEINNAQDGYAYNVEGVGE